MEDIEWHLCFSDWEKPFLPEGQGDYYSWPLITNIFPWQQNGVMPGRTWPVECSKSVLFGRWSALIHSSVEQRQELFKNSPTGRRVDRSANDLFKPWERLKPITEMTGEESQAPIHPYSFRSFDRQWIIPDARLIDRPSRQLWQTISDQQIFMASILTKVLGEGPAATVTQFIPDKHFFSGRGGKDIIPLFRNSAGTEPNITDKLIPLLDETFNEEIRPEDLFAYAYALLANPTYTKRFSEELVVPGPRLPLTKDPSLFRKAVERGKNLIWLHTYGERFVPDGHQTGQVLLGTARCQQGISTSLDQYPESFNYNEAEQILRIGEGEFFPVANEVWNFSVSGLQVVRSWLNYRKKSGYGRRSSPLDEIRPERWTTQRTQELLELLWMLEHTIAAYPELNQILDDIIKSECFKESELPSPSDELRSPPRLYRGPEDITV